MQEKPFFAALNRLIRSGKTKRVDPDFDDDEGQGGSIGRTLASWATFD
jgi:hypothetical protein